MVFGIAGGIMIAGLLLAAITGSIWILISCVAAGIIIAGAGAAVASYKEQISASQKLSHYPPYGY